MSGISDTVWMILTAIVMVAVLFMLVRPGSPALQAVKDVSNALTTLIQISTSNFGGATNGQ
jgi:hypothetical protein